ncbi:hydrogenase iron-sulfur subunit [Halalkaliarchaeum sp. AArc-GB]|uniref:hydrogenase iron-sulfur subunit n=1 Tax=Halalkaliarchaeum sp. AArc-GB TaxID=3074078 RepID=UPI00285BAA2F|nr:hydrogenase iron-sulfur subunit [Halalkaliarchaeum sp. AArc-GB]MDR5673961.1 hydrogenase iron-sulfur subunit [Halalkaliarchaeum sp. AArc-GB]
MTTGAFVCSCVDTCELDLEAVRNGIDGADVIASSSHLCGEEGLPAMRNVLAEHELDEVVITCPEPQVRAGFRDLAAGVGIDGETVTFVDQREGAGWIHEEAVASDKTARLISAAVAGREVDSAEDRGGTLERDAGSRVAVIGDPEAAAALPEAAEVTLFADGSELASWTDDLENVLVERGRLVEIDGRFGDFTVTVESRVSDDCVSCMECVRQGPDGAITRYPVDVAHDAPDGEWTDCCPTDAIEMDGIRRSVEFDQIVYPAGDPRTQGREVGYHTGAVDAGTALAVESLLGGIEKPAHLDLEMDACVAGDSGQPGCNDCVDACPHGAVERAAVDAVEFYPEACLNCGACTSACPTGAVRLRTPSNERIARQVEALVSPTDGGSGGPGEWLFGGDDEGIETPVVAFVCSERAAGTIREYGQLQAAGETEIDYPPLLPVSIDCTDTVGEAHLLHALAAGADGVAVLGCGDDCSHSGPNPTAELVTRCNRAAADLGLGERFAFLSPSPGATAESVDSATEFAESVREFAESLREFVDGLDPSPVPAGEHAATGRLDAVGGNAGIDPLPGRADDRYDGSTPSFASHAWALESVRAITGHADPERDLVRGLKDFGYMEVSEGCTLTPTCATLCPTDAIRRAIEEGRLEFNHELCVNCGICAEGCIEDVLEMHDGLDLSLLPEARGGEPWVTVYEGEVMKCAGCGEPFASTASADVLREKVGDLVGDLGPGEAELFEYCRDCRTSLMAMPSDPAPPEENERDERDERNEKNEE